MKPSQPYLNLARDIRSHFVGPDEGASTSDLRVVLYSHDTMGIGHMRRNILIASEIKAQFPKASVLVIAGAMEACAFAQNAGIDCLTLPSFSKKPNGTYTSRNLDIPAGDVLDVRTQTILATIQSFQPDLFIVDKVACGAGGELLPSLQWLTKNTDCRCVLGMREILDSPNHVQRDWEKTHSFAVIREHFHSIWIYGDPHVFNAVEEYEFPDDIANRVIFTGYLNTRSRLNNVKDTSDSQDPYVLCTVGGGQDGKSLAQHFMESIRETGINSILLTGPYMPSSTRRMVNSYAANIKALKVIEFVIEGDVLLKQASQVVSMGGYNTIAAILTHRKPALIVPRVTPRTEQLIRARRLADLGLVSSIHPDELTSSAISKWLTRNDNESSAARPSLDMNGLNRIGEIIQSEFPCVHSRPHFKRKTEVNEHAR